MAGTGRFWRALASGVGLNALLVLVIFVPFVGMPLVLTLAPALSGWFAGRRVSMEDWLRLSLAGAVLVSMVEWAVALLLMGPLLGTLTKSDLRIGAAEAGILLLILMMNLLFFTAGVRMGAGRGKGGGGRNGRDEEE